VLKKTDNTEKKMKKKIVYLVLLNLVLFVACATVDDINKRVPHTFEKKDPGPEYDFLGNIVLGGFVMSGGGKVAASSAFAGYSEEHAIKTMKQMTYGAGGNYLVIDSIERKELGDNIRYFGNGRAYRLREAYGKTGQLNLTEKGITVQYVLRMEPGPDYEPVRSVATANGVKTGEKGEISGFAKSEEEAIILLRNMSADVGGSLLVIDSNLKDEKSQPVQYEAKGRVFRIKKK
jgi:hypothetical protein